MREGEWERKISLSGFWFEWWARMKSTESCLVLDMLVWDILKSSKWKCQVGNWVYKTKVLKREDQSKITHLGAGLATSFARRSVKWKCRSPFKKLLRPWLVWLSQLGIVLSTGQLHFDSRSGHMLGDGLNPGWWGMINVLLSRECFSASFFLSLRINLKILKNLLRISGWQEQSIKPSTETSN